MGAFENSANLAGSFSILLLRSSSSFAEEANLIS